MAHKGKILSEEHKRKISESIKKKWKQFELDGRKNEIIQKTANKNKGRRCNPAGEFKKGHITWNKGTKGLVKAWNKGLPPERQSRWQGGKKMFFQQHARKMMEEHLGRKLSSGELIHHKNHNWRDNRIENFQIMTRAEHINHHRDSMKYGGFQKGNTPWNKGKKASPEVRAKIIAGCKRRDELKLKVVK